jgi:hypothetical protein
MPRPYGKITVFDPKYPMDMIRHNHEFVQFNVPEMFWNGVPAILHHHPNIIQPHPTINHIPKQTLPPPGTHRHEIPPGTNIIIIPQSHRPTPMQIRMKCHFPLHIKNKRCNYRRARAGARCAVPRLRPPEFPSRRQGV